MTKYDQLREESKKLHKKITALEVWLENNQLGKTKHINSSKEGVILNDKPKEFIPYITIANRESRIYGNLDFDVADIELEVLLPVIIPVLEGLHHQFCDQQQDIDSKLEAVDKLLGDN